MSSRLLCVVSFVTFLKVSFNCGELCANSASLTCVQDKESVMDILKIIDKSNGYVFKGIEGNINEFYKIAAAPLNWDYYRYPPCLLLYYVCVEVINLARTMIWLAPMKYVWTFRKGGDVIALFLVLCSYWRLYGVTPDFKYCVCLDNGLCTTMAVQEKYIEDDDSEPM